MMIYPESFNFLKQFISFNHGLSAIVAAHVRNRCLNLWILVISP
jgi:hypothetical protein